MRYNRDGLTNLRNCIGNAIINARCKSLVITAQLGFPLRGLISWYLKYYRNLTNGIEVGSSIALELINFILGIRYKGPLGVTPRSSSFEEEPWCGV